jgi:hypothetical protein
MCVQVAVMSLTHGFRHETLRALSLQCASIEFIVNQMVQRIGAHHDVSFAALSNVCGTASGVSVGSRKRRCGSERHGQLWAARLDRLDGLVVDWKFKEKVDGRSRK